MILNVVVSNFDCPQIPHPLFQTSVVYHGPSSQLELRMVSESEAKSFRPSRAMPCMPRMLRMTPVPWWQRRGFWNQTQQCIVEHWPKTLLVGCITWHNLYNLYNGIFKLVLNFKSMYSNLYNQSMEPIIPIQRGLWHFSVVWFWGDWVVEAWYPDSLSLRGPGGRFRVGDKVLLGSWDFGFRGLRAETMILGS